MKALFLTTKTGDCENHVQAFRSFAPAEHVTFNHMAIRNDWQLVEAAKAARPDVIFYIGACPGGHNPPPGIPRLAALAEMNSIAPLINIVSDAGDWPWHKPISGYAAKGCFSLQVAIDGAQDVQGLDMSTLTPVDPVPFAFEYNKRIRCGFSGSVGRHNDRSELIFALRHLGGLTVRDRAQDYADHARFMRLCRMILNVSKTGTGHCDHIKGRVVEAGWAGCCLLESKGSPIGKWFPDDCYITYDGPLEAAGLIASLDDATIDRTAARLAEEVRNRFRPEQIYGQMLERVGVTMKVAA